MCAAPAWSETEGPARTGPAGARAALTDRDLEVAARQGLVRQLFEGKVPSTTLALVQFVVSGGRAEMGIGGGWYEHEWRAYGYGFPSAGARLGMLDEELAAFLAAAVPALIGVLRWREENNVLASVTGASRDSIGGAVWIGQEA